MKPESKWDYKLSRVRTPGLLCHFLHKTTFPSTASLQDFSASGCYFHSLISVLYYCERQRLITTEVLECYQIALQTAGAGTITASATAPLPTPLGASSVPVPLWLRSAGQAPSRGCTSTPPSSHGSSLGPSKAHAASCATSPISWWYYTRSNRINTSGWSRHL